jgi:hypothetical protein
MKRSRLVLSALALCAICSSVHAVYTVAYEGTWPKTWPKELDALRGQSRTLVGPTLPQLTYEIPITRRDDFEAAWPHLLKIKSKGAPVILVRSPYTFMSTIKAGVVIHCPPAGTDRRLTPEGPLPGQSNPRTTWMNTSYLELIVDGDVVDLNRIPLPADTPIIDERFEKRELPGTRPLSGAGRKEHAERPSPNEAPATPAR